MPIDMPPDIPEHGDTSSQVVPEVRSYNAMYEEFEEVYRKKREELAGLKKELERLQDLPQEVKDEMADVKAQVEIILDHFGSIDALEHNMNNINTQIEQATRELGELEKKLLELRQNPETNPEVMRKLQEKKDKFIRDFGAGAGEIQFDVSKPELIKEIVAELGKPIQAEIEAKNAKWNELVTSGGSIERNVAEIKRLNPLIGGMMDRVIQKTRFSLDRAKELEKLRSNVDYDYSKNERLRDEVEDVGRDFDRYEQMEPAQIVEEIIAMTGARRSEYNDVLEKALEDSLVRDLGDRGRRLFEDFKFEAKRGLVYALRKLNEQLGEGTVTGTAVDEYLKYEESGIQNANDTIYQRIDKKFADTGVPGWDGKLDKFFSETLGFNDIDGIKDALKDAQDQGKTYLMDIVHELDAASKNKDLVITVDGEEYLFANQKDKLIFINEMLTQIYEGLDPESGYWSIIGVLEDTAGVLGEGVEGLEDYLLPEELEELEVPGIPDWLKALYVMYRIVSTVSMRRNGVGIGRRWGNTSGLLTNRGGVIEPTANPMMQVGRKVMRLGFHAAFWQEELLVRATDSIASILQRFPGTRSLLERFGNRTPEATRTGDERTERVELPADTQEFRRNLREGAFRELERLRSEGHISEIQYRLRMRTLTRIAIDLPPNPRRPHLFAQQVLNCVYGRDMWFRGSLTDFERNQAIEELSRFNPEDSRIATLEQAANTALQGAATNDPRRGRIRRLFERVRQPRSQAGDRAYDPNAYYGSYSRLEEEVRHILNPISDADLPGALDRIRNEVRRMNLPQEVEEAVIAEIDRTVPYDETRAGGVDRGFHSLDERIERVFRLQHLYWSRRSQVDTVVETPANRTAYTDQVRNTLQRARGGSIDVAEMAQIESDIETVLTDTTLSTLQMQQRIDQILSDTTALVDDSLTTARGRIEAEVMRRIENSATPLTDPEIHTIIDEICDSFTTLPNTHLHNELANIRTDMHNVVNTNPGLELNELSQELNSVITPYINRTTPNWQQRLGNGIRRRRALSKVRQQLQRLYDNTFGRVRQGGRNFSLEQQRIVEVYEQSFVVPEIEATEHEEQFTLEAARRGRVENTLNRYYTETDPVRVAVEQYLDHVDDGSATIEDTANPGTRRPIRNVADFEAGLIAVVGEAHMTANPTATIDPSYSITDFRAGRNPDMQQRPALADAVRVQNRQFRNELTPHIATLDALEQDIQAAESTLISLNTSIQGLQSRIQTITTDIQRITNRLTGPGAGSLDVRDRANLIADLETHNANLPNLESELETLRGQRDDLSDQIQTIPDALRTAGDEINTITNTRYADLERDAQSEATISTNQSRPAALTRRVQNLGQQLLRTEGSFASMTTSIENSHQNLERAGRRASSPETTSSSPETLDQTRIWIQQEIGILESDLASLNSFYPSNGTENAQMTARRNGLMRIYGIPTEGNVLSNFGALRTAIQSQIQILQSLDTVIGAVSDGGGVRLTGTNLQTLEQQRITVSERNQRRIDPKNEYSRPAPEPERNRRADERLRINIDDAVAEFNRITQALETGRVPASLNSEESRAITDTERTQLEEVLHILAEDVGVNGNPDDNVGGMRGERRTAAQIKVAFRQVGIQVDADENVDFSSTLSRGGGGRH